MASNIDATQPPAGAATTAALRANMAAAKSEIEDLQHNALVYVRANFTGENVSIPTNPGLLTPVPFNVLATPDPLGMWDPVNFTMNLAPAYAAGFTHFRARAQIQYPGNATGWRNARIEDANDTNLSGDRTATADATAHTQSKPDTDWQPINNNAPETMLLKVSAGQNSGVTLALQNVSPPSYFSIELKKMA